MYLVAFTRFQADLVHHSRLRPLADYEPATHFGAITDTLCDAERIARDIAKTRSGVNLPRVFEMLNDDLASAMIDAQQFFEDFINQMRQTEEAYDNTRDIHRRRLATDS